MGIGMGIADFFSCDIKKAVTFFDKFPKDRREFLLQGMGLYFYKISNFDRDAFEDKIAKGSKEYKQYFREGIEVFHELVDHNP
jgi:hypothetical protein